MSFASVFLTLMAIVGGTVLVLFGLFRLGKIVPGLAYYPPAHVILIVVLALALFGVGVANVVLQFAPALILHAIVFCSGLVLAYGVLDLTTYRLTWDASGFSIRRFARKPLEAAWSQVAGFRWLITSEIQINFAHSDQPKAYVPCFLIGGRNFVAALHQNAAPKR